MGIALDGETKRITLTGDVFFIDKDIYDAAIDWSVLEANMQYLLPMDYVSPDFRLLSGWKIAASGYDSGTLVTISGSIVAVSGDRVATGQIVEWDIGTTIHTIFVPTGSGLSKEEHDQLMGTLTDETEIELDINMKEAMRVMLAVLAGKSSGGGTSTVKFRDTEDSKDRISATVDALGNRTEITLDVD
jgi:hypothetical protein